jgi:hypothetical protein
MQAAFTDKVIYFSQIKRARKKKIPMHTYLDAILDSDSCERVELGDLMFDVAWAAAAAAAAGSARITI